MLDSFHNAKHVKKILYYYYKKLKCNGLFFIDDISWLPYLNQKKRSNFNCEINNLETYEKILEISLEKILFQLIKSYQANGVDVKKLQS